MVASGDRILIIKPSSLGDIVHALQVVDGLKAQIAEVRITWVASSVFAPLVRACSLVDEVIEFERGDGLSGFWRLVQELRRREFDWVIDLQGLARSGLMTLSSRCARERKIGRSDAREGACLAYGRRMPLPEGGEYSHAVDILMECLPMLGLEKKNGPGLRFAVETPFGIAGVKLPIVLFPASRRKEKEWGGFGELAHVLCAENPDRAVVWSDSKAGGAVSEAENFHDLSGKTTLQSMVGLIQMASLVVCNDSGPMHIAAALGKPVLALFGPTDPHLYGPWPLNAPGNHVLVAPEGKLEKLRVETVAVEVERLYRSIC